MIKLLRGSFGIEKTLLAVLFFLCVGDAFAWGSVKAGSIMTFGKYPQTALGEIKPIEWRVLEVKDNKALLLADKGLDAVPYHVEYSDITWKNSTIRQWLNSDFYNKAFNDSEKSRISITVLKNSDNPKYGTLGGVDTRDRVFLLSLDEAEWYLIYDAERVLQPTPYAVKKGAFTNKRMQSSAWWLRSPGGNVCCAAGVYTDGALDFGCFDVRLDDISVRPALWIDL